MSFIFFTGCKSDTDEVIMDNQNMTNEKSINVKVDNNMLHFDTRNDYEKAVEQLSSIGDGKLESWENELSFKSMRAQVDSETREENGIVDDVLATLLNPEGKISIDNNIFTIDVLNESVLVTNKDTNSNKKSLTKDRTFDIDDNVLDILEGKETESNLKFWRRKKRWCRSSKKGAYYWENNGTRIKHKIVFQRAGIYNSLQAKIKKVNTWGGPINISLTTKGTNFWRNRRSTRYFNDSVGGSRRVYNIRPYSSTRRLKDYRFNVEFYAYNAETGWARYTTLELRCSR